MEQDYILKVEHVSKQFPGVKALDDVSIGVREVQFTHWLERMARENQH